MFHAKQSADAHGGDRRRHLACTVPALCCWCGQAQAADEAEQCPSVTREERLLLKK